MADDRASRSFSDVPGPTLLVDTRASQSLEPIRLPAKLRDRIDRAQRRAAAAKDGVSIFTTESKDPGSAGALARRTTTAPAAETSTSTMFGSMGELHRASTASGGNASPSEKMHLPDVVLSHKMRDFEARANTGGGVALFSVEPADRSLQRLSLEDRERVMLAMQSKIRQIANDVDANFARITKALDANGIFDSSANIQRAQTLCLVELQRRCKLDKLRDEAMREVLHLSASSSKATSRGENAASKPSRKLSQLLKPLSRGNPEETEVPVAVNATTIKRRKRKPVRASKLPALRRGGDSSSKYNQKADTSSVGLQDNENTKSPGRMASRRGGLAPPSATAQFMAREDVGFGASVGTTSASEGDIFSRHPHVAQVLQLLAAGETLATKTSTNVNLNTAEADMEHMRLLDPIDEWMQCSASYQAVGTRAAEALRRCSERQRWDTLGHFGSSYVCLGVSCIPPVLRQRLDHQHSSWLFSGTSSRSDGNNEVVEATDKGSSNQQQRDKEVYAELQARIRERLRATEKRTRTAAAAVRSVVTSGRPRVVVPQTAPVTGTSSTVSLPTSEVSPSQGCQQLPLGISASEPALPVSLQMEPTPEAKSFSPPRHSRLGSRVQVSVLEQKLMADPSQPITRHGRRKESLIGAPHGGLDRNVIGRHSEARIAYRRYSAQTWAWHLPPGASTPGAVDTINEEDDERNEANDQFDDEGCDQGDEEGVSEEGENATEYADSDLESVDSSRTSFSARSTISMGSVIRRTSSGNRKHGRSKRPMAVQRRPSRGPGGRSAGNTLTGHALSLHARLEVIWRVLQFPFSNKLSMLERLSTLQDADAFLLALDHWERVTPLVAIRQRMKLALSGFAERGELRPNEWLTPSEFALVTALPRPSSGPEHGAEVMPPLKTSTREFDSMSPSAFVDWVRKHIDVVTLQTQKLASELKAHTGEELQFQGQSYPCRG